MDNNEDGIVDDPLIEAQLISKNALIPIFYDDGNAAMNTFENYYQGDGVSAVLYNFEIAFIKPRSPDGKISELP